MKEQLVKIADNYEIKVSDIETFEDLCDFIVFDQFKKNPYRTVLHNMLMITK